MKVEILAGGGIKTAFKELGIEATCTYKGKNFPHYQVWRLEKSDLRKLDEVESWPEHYGWWRYAKRSNLGTACSIFTINGQELIAWEDRDYLREEWEGEPSCEKEAYNYSYKEYEECWKPHEYNKLTAYLCEELGCSTESNVCAVAAHLATTNGLSLSELFAKFEG